VGNTHSLAASVTVNAKTTVLQVPPSMNQSRGTILLTLSFISLIISSEASFGPPLEVLRPFSIAPLNEQGSDSIALCSRVGKNPGFKKKTTQWVFWFFYIFAQKREFLGLFSFKNTFRCIQTLNCNHSY
jgi:hypothetical protein